MKPDTTPLRRLTTFFLQPHKLPADDRRREPVLNVLLTGLMLISFIAVGLSTTSLVVSTHPNPSPFSYTLVFLLVIVGLWHVSRSGFYRLSAIILIGFVWYSAAQLMFSWSVALPQAQLTFALTIVMSGVLLGSTAAIGISSATVLSILIVGYYQANGYLETSTAWLNRSLFMGDVISYCIVLSIIGLVSWLSNRETHASLKRAEASELALTHERDNLERKVQQRTRQLEAAQRQRLLELGKLADFGKLSSGIFHDLSQPLTVASLNLEALNQKQRSAIVKDLTTSINQLQRYVEAAQKQLRQESIVGRFSVKSELEQVIDILRYRARHAQIELALNCPDCRLTGDPIKFSQLAANLVSNAIDAYPLHSNPSHKRLVNITVNRRQSAITLVVQDWGQGIAPSAIKHIFDPFYSTKQASCRNIGIGLTTARMVAHEAFRGSLTVKSSPGQGTVFTAQLHDVVAK